MSQFLKYLFSFISSVVVSSAGFIVYLIWFQSPFYFPKPTGQYSVGTKTYHWIDTKRKELHDNNPAHPFRELMVKIWYPSTLKLRRTGPAQGKSAEKPTTPYAPYFVDYFKKNKPLIWLALLSRPMYCYAKPDATLTTDIPQLPIIIFSPGFRSIYDGNTSSCEELASQGYIVVGISHPYNNSVIQFPDGRVILNKTYNPDDSAEIWLADVQFVLNQLEQLAHNEKSIFYQRLDLNHIGMFGHSMGGSTAIKSSLFDSRIKAAVNLDGALFGSKITKKIDKPCMVMLAEIGVNFNERPLTQQEWKKHGIHSLEEEIAAKADYLPALKQLAQSAQHDFYTRVIKDAGHFDFCDLTLLKSASPIVKIIATLDSSILSILKLGSIDGFRATEIVNAYLVTFFNKYLKGRPSAILDGTSKKYAEVESKLWANA